MSLQLQPAIFLDRDGVINQLVWDHQLESFESPYRTEDLYVLATAILGIKRLLTLGLPVIVTSNQPSAAKKITSLKTLQAINQKVVTVLAYYGLHLSDYYYCYHHPAGKDKALTTICECRKPKPGMLFEAAQKHSLDLQKSWFVGDSATDIEAGYQADCKTVLIENPLSAHRRKQLKVDPTLTAPDLLVAANCIASQLSC